MAGPTTITEINPNGFAQRYTNILQTLVVISIAVAGMWTAIIFPLERRLQRLQDDRQEFITIREYEEFKKRSDSVDDNVSTRVNKVAADVDYLRSNLVSKELHLTLRSDLETFKQLVGGQYTISDKVKELQNEIATLRAIMLNQNNGNKDHRNGS